MMQNLSEKQWHSSTNTYTFRPPKTIIFVERKRQSDRIAMAFAQAGFDVISVNS